MSRADFVIYDQPRFHTTTTSTTAAAAAASTISFSLYFFLSIYLSFLFSQYLLFVGEKSEFHTNLFQFST